MARSEDQRSTEAAEALEHLGRLSLRELSMESLLQSMADLTKRVMPGDPEASVTLLIKDQPSTVVDTGPLALNLDAAQYERGDGPCLHAARTGVAIEIIDTRADGRWPDYARHAAEHGNFSSLSVPLLLAGEEEYAGALNICARTPDAFDEASRVVATGFAPYAAVAVGTVQAYRSARKTADNLQIALESRAVIEQAKGILIERHKLTPDQACEALATVSMSRNVKVRDIAEHLVLTGELPLVRTTRADPLTRRSSSETNSLLSQALCSRGGLPGGSPRSGHATPDRGVAGPPSLTGRPANLSRSLAGHLGVLSPTRLT